VALRHHVYRKINRCCFSQEILSDLKESAPNVDGDSLVKLVSFCTALSKAEATTAAYPEFPVDSLKMAARILNNNPHLPVGEVIQRLYPYKLFLPRENWAVLESLFESFDIAVGSKGVEQQIVAVEPAVNGSQAKISLKVDNKSVTFHVPGGVAQPLLKNETQFIETNYQNNVLADIVQSYAAGDFCLIGPRGSGKSALVAELCKRLGQTFEPMVLYQDMTTRDLIQQRTTKLNGDTVWRDSPLVTAARNGHIAVLDSVHRIHHSTVSILHRLVHDRELQLYDGKRLMRHDKYDELLASGMTQEALESQGLFRIHPSFRIIALGEPPTLDSGACWLTPEMLSLFIFHEIRNLSKNEEIAIIRALYGEKISPSLMKIINLGHFLRESKDSILRNLSGTLSTRQLLRLAHRYSIYSKGNVSGPTLLGRFLGLFL
jgi:von Willebrand factor A domain-containing protein 8